MMFEFITLMMAVVFIALLCNYLEYDGDTDEAQNYDSFDD